MAEERCFPKEPKKEVPVLAGLAVFIEATDSQKGRSAKEACANIYDETASKQ